MSSTSIISTDRQAREIEIEIDEISRALSSENILKSIIEGLSREVIDSVRRSLITEKRELSSMLQAYSQAKNGNTELLKKLAGTDLGDVLIVARLAQGWTQKDLARKLGLQEQAIQRWEAERYRAISLTNYMKLAYALSLNFSVNYLCQEASKWMPTYEINPAEAQKILKHARKHGWLDTPDSDEKSTQRLIQYVSEHVSKHGTPSLLRTGINVKDYTENWVLLSWKAHVTRRAEEVIRRDKPKYRPLNLRWLKQLPKLSQATNGPLQAQLLLKQHGIILIVERDISGMDVDGASFLVDEIPVIGLTLRKDAIDNFWFTLLHEVGHVILHYRTGLASGFFDDVDHDAVDEFEKEANKFASNLLIPEEIWVQSPARIAKISAPVENLAKQLGIAPAIIYGRIRFERKNYTLFSSNIGQGTIRKLFFSPPKETQHA